MKVKIDGKWSKHRKPTPRVMHSSRCENVRLNRHDMRELARLSDRELCARVRQIAARANNRAKLYPHQKSTLSDPMDGNGFHSGGIVSTPPGRRPSWPEMQFIRPKGRLVWPVAEPNEAKVSFEKPSGMGKSESLVGVDFADIEKRVMAQIAESPGRFYAAEFQARQHGKTLRHTQAAFDAKLREAAKATVRAALDSAWQNLTDEEGCGATLAALKEWKE